MVRLGAETSRVGADVRAAIASWGPADTVLGGIALLGVTPLGCAGPVEAVILVPRGVVIVVGVDLPDPALRLDAPLDAPWKADGWPLVREDGAVNPAGEALAAARAVTDVLQERRLEPVPVNTIVAVGPYVGQVTQSTVDLHQGVRVLYPEPRTMLTAMRELGVADRPCSVEQARRLLSVLVGDRVPMLIGEVAAEGFVDAVTPDLATASTTLIPRITDQTRLPRGNGGGGPRRRRADQLRWLPMAALGLLAALLIAGVAVALGTTGQGGQAAAGSTPPVPPSVTVGGVSFSRTGSAQATDCAGHAYGDVQVWLSEHQCVDLARSTYQTTSDGHPAAVALAVLTFHDVATAKAFSAVANATGSGGITDLVKDGAGWRGGPKSFDDAAYTVLLRDASVRLTEVVWIGRTSSPTDPALTKLADSAAELPASP
ncbi:MAG TPA: hypothetical protein VH333_21100 [Pseudonocardiaceae bacterium]|jgi:hypothetical protein|nr:hypothetical protein [Pseudonocardiaceae bacterium]